MMPEFQDGKQSFSCRVLPFCTSAAANQSPNHKYSIKAMFGREGVANMASYAISSSLILVIHDNMIIETNLIVLACLCRHF
jgi:hypothetical protein